MRNDFASSKTPFGSSTASCRPFAGMLLSCSTTLLTHAGCGSRGAYVIVVADQLVDDFDQSMVDVEKRKSKCAITSGLAPVMAAFIQVSRIHSVGVLRC